MVLVLKTIFCKDKDIYAHRETIERQLLTKIFVSKYLLFVIVKFTRNLISVVFLLNFKKQCSLICSITPNFSTSVGIYYYFCSAQQSTFINGRQVRKDGNYIPRGEATKLFRLPSRCDRFAKISLF